MLHRYKTGLILAVSLMVLTGCAALGLPVAKTFNQRLASGYTTVTAVGQATSAFIDARVATAPTAEPERAAYIAVTRKDAQNVKDQAAKAKEGLDIAGSLRNIDLKSAETRLASTLILLQTLQAYLEGK